MVQEIKALGARTLTSFATTSACISGGAYLGTMISPGVGTIIGGVVGALISLIVNYFVENEINDYFKAE